MLKKWVYKISGWLAAWHQRHLSSVDFVHVVAIIIGLLCGIAAGLLRNGIDLVTGVIFSHFDIHRLNLIVFLIPIAGIFIATAWSVYITRRPMDHTSDRIVTDLNSGNTRLSPHLILGPIIGNSITLGLGGSAGSAGPIAYSGAAIGSNVGKAFRVDTDTMSNLVGCGAAAAIAGIFMAPIGGVMFALEVLRMRQSLSTVLAIVLSSLMASLTCYIMNGCNTDVTFVPEMRFDLWLIPWVVACGIFCGIYTVYYGTAMTKLRLLSQKISNRWLRALTGGVILAVLVALFPSLYGEGYGILRQLMAGDGTAIVAYGPFYRFGSDIDILLILMAVVLLIKPLATSATNDSGAVGGGFTPTFFSGGVAGFMFAIALNHFFGLHLPLALFAFFGMAAVMSGALRAPLMAIFIAAEMTGLYGFILPLTLAAMTSFLTSLWFRRIKLAAILKDI